ncbi:DUF1090 domain-containing protein [Shewanella oneidensis MR-1]|uniref:DUF1090 domain-containing protein n=1 Tax=Shewanella oneidensis (strain ATCC 700550 / JCM 31522 / CIP 106686 / LMG 19005 / NCIMB 14063 / MR-1) TaxID=211586 RepID=Q8EKH4_SHEON|nr:DUF1090 domain-containing protein [Shewanella oneidensis]AAN53206.1 periplasmic protein of unknown function DUF1090 [Shewanella oneidensis MR-1]MDX5997900.1 DUF1090 domain-containing protein [Shewanella oneidensis]MEE2026952.1 Protein YqjC [Shewanella oneidensis]QKG95092.1 DUF1090 domain-containing protein [Shewanella oneidensis MR-1]
MLIKYHTYILVFGLVFSGLAWADELATTGCAAKLATINAELAEAKAAGNQHKVAGLEKAYAEVVNHCADDRLAVERLAKVEALEVKLAERQHELTEAIADGKPMDKINKKRQKIAEVESELAKVRAELTQ